MATRTPQTAAHVNDRVRELSYELTDEPVPFFCECGDPHCVRAVWLTCAEFDQERALGHEVVAEHARMAVPL